MAAPTLSAADRAAIDAEKAIQAASVADFTAAKAFKGDQLQRYTDLDVIYKAQYDYYDGDILAQYESELKWMNGKYHTTILRESDIDDTAQLTALQADGITGRLTPTLPVTDIVRIDEFDGTNFEGTIFISSELALITFQAGVESDLVTEFPSNAERTAKVTAGDQARMDALISALESTITSRRTALTNQDTALGLNLDPDGTAEIAAQIVLNGDTDTFLANYLGTTDISDAGLATLSAERGTRTTEIATRDTQIAANRTGQTENYADKRYDMANLRASTLTGSLRLKYAQQTDLDTMDLYIDGAQGAVDGMNTLT